MTGGPGLFMGPCYYCVRAGTPVGVQAVGGSVTLRDNLFRNLSLQMAVGSEPGYAIHTLHTSGTYLVRNTVVSLGAGSPCVELRARRSEASPSLPLIPCPPMSAVHVIAIASEGDATLYIADNSLESLVGAGRDAQAIGILAQDVGNAVLTRNSLSGIVGGYSDSYGSNATAVGVWMEGLSTAEINANVLGDIHGGGGGLSYFFPADYGGGAVGIKLITATAATVINNSVWSLTGGRGGSCAEESYSCYVGGNGGDATALLVSGGPAHIQNNTFHQTTAGSGGDGSSSGQPGTAVGLRLVGDADVLAVNNALIGHGIGISSTCQNAPILGYNDLWDNDVDYVGVSPGVNDLHAAPGFVDAEDGDFHLRPDSPLIDAGTNVNPPDEDFEGDLRRLDGDNDGFAVVDIGADEYWIGLHGSAKMVDPPIATPGLTLTYRLIIVNPSSWCVLSGVVLTDTIAAGTTYLEGSLQASSGTWGYAGGVITWTGTVSATEVVTLTFDVVVDEMVGPHVIINQALLDDQVGQVQTLQATVLVNPLRFYLPLVLR